MVNIVKAPLSYSTKKSKEQYETQKSFGGRRSFFIEEAHVILSYTTAASRNSSEPAVVFTRATKLSSLTRIDFL
jgi:hypothetical protein